MAITDEIIGLSQLLLRHVPGLPQKSTPMVNYIVLMHSDVRVSEFDFQFKLLCRDVIVQFTERSFKT